MIKHAVLNISSRLQWHNLATNTHLLCPLRSVPFALAWFFQNFNTFQYGAGLVFVINVACVMLSTRPTRVFARAQELPNIEYRFDFSRKHASSIAKHENLGTSIRGIAREYSMLAQHNIFLQVLSRR